MFGGKDGVEVGLDLGFDFGGVCCRQEVEGRLLGGGLSQPT